MSTIRNKQKTMERLPRLRPINIPAIHPLPEYMATGKVADWYEETKQVLQVPLMGGVTMAFAHYPNFFGELWRSIWAGYSEIFSIII